MFFLYQGLSTCFYPKFVRQLILSLLNYSCKGFFGQRDYNYFYCIIETTFLRLLIGSAPRRNIREIFLFHEIYTQHSHIKAR